MQKIITLLSLCFFLTLSACGKKQDDAASKKPSLPLITVTQAEKTNLEVREQSIGTIEGIIDPTIAAEVAGRVTKVLTRPGEPVRHGQALIVLDPTDLNLQRVEAQAEVARVEALLSNQEKIVERNQVLLKKNFISQNALDDVATQKKPHWSVNWRPPKPRLLSSNITATRRQFMRRSMAKLKN